MPKVEYQQFHKYNKRRPEFIEPRIPDNIKSYNETRGVKVNKKSFQKNPHKKQSENDDSEGGSGLIPRWSEKRGRKERHQICGSC